MAVEIKPEKSRARKLLTQERLKELLHYDPETGVWTWRVSRGGRLAGSHAGTLSKALGYVMISIDKEILYAHRLAMLYMTGNMPPEVDHVNRDGSDCKWKNLRAATHSENLANVSGWSSNTSGARGVVYQKDARLYRANIEKNGKRIFLGYFKTVEEASAVYLEAARRLNGEFSYK